MKRHVAALSAITVICLLLALILYRRRSNVSQESFTDGDDSLMLSKTKSLLQDLSMQLVGYMLLLIGSYNVRKTIDDPSYIPGPNGISPCNLKPQLIDGKFNLVPKVIAEVYKKMEDSDEKSSLRQIIEYAETSVNPMINMLMNS